MPSPNCELISFGSDITKPAELENCTAGDILASIRDGQWREPVLRVRSLPPDSIEQRDAKKKLPYVTWSGVFDYRTNDGLVQHSGLIGIDIDDLTSLDCTKAIQDAVADPHCLAAYRSVRNNGVRIIIRVPPCSAAEHEFTFEQVAEYVRLLTLPGQRPPYHAYEYRLIDANPTPLAPIIRVLSGPQATQSATGGGSSAPETWAQGEDTATPALNLPNLDMPREITISQTLEALRQ